MQMGTSALIDDTLKPIANRITTIVANNTG